MTIITSSKIADFAKAVRSELSDLPLGEVRELTDGLEADLFERLAEEGEAVDFGSPAAYAAELRDAAGISPKPARRSAFSAEVLMQNLQSWFRRTAFGSAILDFGISIRPLWWVLRASVAWWLFVGVFYTIQNGLWLLLLLVFLSVQWGRKKWFTGKFFAAVLLPLNLLAIVLLVPTQAMFVIKLQNYASAEAMMQAWPATQGLRYDGDPVTELKAFDSSGEQIEGLTFKDQNGLTIEIPVIDVTYFEVPDVIGLTIPQANEAFMKANLPAVDFIYDPGATDKNGVVTEIGPAKAGDLITEFDVLEVKVGPIG